MDNWQVSRLREVVVQSRFERGERLALETDGWIATRV